ncbi:16874_t:CDS:1, partial [Gigaspora margarita]
SRISVYTDKSKISEDSFNDFNMHCDDEEAVAEKNEMDLEEETILDLESE